MTSTHEQQFIDRFYFDNGPCCSGCDWWVPHSVTVGDCTKSAPVSAAERLGMLEMHSCSLPLQAGHILTKRDHHCGDFKDEFDWSSLPLAYQKRVGAPIAKSS